MPKSYHHITYIQRSQIVILKDRGDSLNKIAKALNVHHTTISREIKRNSGKEGYNYQQADVKAMVNRPSHPKKKMARKQANCLACVVRIELKRHAEREPVGKPGFQFWPHLPFLEALS